MIGLHLVTKVAGVSVAANAAAAAVTTAEQVGGGAGPGDFTITFEMTTGNFDNWDAGSLPYLIELMQN